MKKLHESVFFNGEIISAGDEGYSVINRGFLYGDGFFESMRFENDNILFAEDHFQRLHRSLMLLELSGEGIPDIHTCTDYIRQLNKKNHGGAYARVRLNIFRDVPGLYAPTGNRAAWLLQVNALEGPYQWPEKGITAGIYTRQAKARGPFASIKSLSSQFYVMAAIHAQKEKWNDALVLNTGGHVIEATSSNLFLVYNNTLITPPISEGCIDGVSRKYLLDLADRHGIPFREQIITETEINLASEIILTNTIRGMQWVERIGKQSYSSKMAKELFRLFFENRLPVQP